MDERRSVDRRVARTRLAIRNALVTLMKEKGFEALTVKDVVDRADINRGTFYLHYRDKYDLLERTETEILQDLQRIFLRAKSLTGSDLDSAEAFQQLIMTVLEYVRDHADLMYAILGLQGDYSFIVRIRDTLERNLNLGVLAGLKVENFLVPREYLIAYLLHAHLGVLQAWLVAGCQESPRDLARILFRLSFEGPMHAAGLGINGFSSLPTR